MVDLLQAQHVGAVVQHLAKDEGPAVAPLQREAGGGGVQLSGVLVGQAVGQHIVRHDAEAPGRRGGGGGGSGGGSSSGCGSSRSRCRCCCRRRCRCGQACIGLQLAGSPCQPRLALVWHLDMAVQAAHQQPGTWQEAGPAAVTRQHPSWPARPAQRSAPATARSGDGGRGGRHRPAPRARERSGRRCQSGSGRAGGTRTAARR